MFNQTNTHMPFLVPMPNGRVLLLFCKSENRIWKIHYAIDGGLAVRLKTGFNVETECSPTAWYDESGLHLSFIAGGSPEEPLFRLYRMDGPTINQLSAPSIIRPTSMGFIYHDRLVFSEPFNLTYIHEPTGNTTLAIPDAAIYRTAYRADNPQILIISGKIANDLETFTILYDLSTDQQFIIKCDGLPAYKCTILQDMVIYAERLSSNFEDRRLRIAKDVQLLPTTIARRI